MEDVGGDISFVVGLVTMYFVICFFLGSLVAGGFSNPLRYGGVKIDGGLACREEVVQEQYSGVCGGGYPPPVHSKMS